MKTLKKRLKNEANEICNRCRKELRSMTEEEVARINEIKEILEALTAVDNEDPKDEAPIEDEVREDEDKKDEELPEDDKKEDEECREDEEEEKKPEDEAEAPSDDAEDPMDDEEDKEKETRSYKTHKTISKTKNNSKKMEKRFSILNAINAVINNGKLDATEAAVVNSARNEMRKAGLSYSGQIQLPVNARALQVTGATGVHDDLVETEFQDILAPLYAKNVLVQAGAKILTGCVGDIQVPVMDAGNVYWASEVATAQNGQGDIDSVRLTPKRLTAYIDMSKQFLAQDSLDAEALIREDLANAINAKLEATVLGAAAGSDTQPAGIFYSTSTLTSISDYAGVCDFEADVETANVYGECKYIMSPKAKAIFRNMAKSANHTELVFADGTLDGTPVLSTSHVTDKYVAYGDFSNLAIAQWGGIDLTVDPYTKAAEGMVRIVVNCYFDAKVLRPEAIAVAKAAVATA